MILPPESELICCLDCSNWIRSCSVFAEEELAGTWASVLRFRLAIFARIVVGDVESERFCVEALERGGRKKKLVWWYNVVMRKKKISPQPKAKMYQLNKE